MQSRHGDSGSLALGRGKEQVVMSLLMLMLSNRMIVAGPLHGNEKTGSVWGAIGATVMTGPLDPGVSEAELDSAWPLDERIVGKMKPPLSLKPTGSN